MPAEAAAACAGHRGVALCNALSLRAQEARQGRHVGNGGIASLQVCVFPLFIHVFIFFICLYICLFYLFIALFVY